MNLSIFKKQLLFYIMVAILVVFSGILLTFVTYQLILASHLGITFILQITMGNAINLTATLVCFSLLFFYLHIMNKKIK